MEVGNRDIFLKCGQVPFFVLYADAVEIVKKWDGEFPGSVEKVLELDAFQTALLGNVCDQRFAGPLNSLVVKKKVFVYTDKLLLLNQYLEYFLNPIRVCFGKLNNFFVFGWIERPGFEERFDAAEHFLLIVAERFLMFGQRQEMFPYDEFALRYEHLYEAIENILFQPGCFV